MLKWRMQNLNDGSLDNAPHRHPFWHARGWLHVDTDKHPRLQCAPSLAVEWVHELRAQFACTLAFNADESGGVQLALGFPWARYFVHVMTSGYQDRARREVGVRYHDGLLFWSLWEDRDRWSSSDPWWQRGSFDVAAFVLGKMQFTEESLRVMETDIPLPDGETVRARVEMVRRTHSRKRWFPRFGRYAEISVQKPPVIPGKGESGYDCGDDGIYSMSVPARDVADGIGQYIASVLRARGVKPASRLVAL